MNTAIASAILPLPKGYIARAVNAAVVDITGLSVSWFADATRLYKTTLSLFSSQQTAQGVQQITICDGGNVIKQLHNVTVASGFNESHNLILVESGLSGTVVRKGRANANAGSMTIAGSATYHAFIIVEDIGRV